MSEHTSVKRSHDLNLSASDADRRNGIPLVLTGGWITHVARHDRDPNLMVTMLMRSVVGMTTEIAKAITVGRIELIGDSATGFYPRKVNTQTVERSNVAVKELSRAVVYARASQAAEVEAQISKCRVFMAANGYTEQGICSEVGSGKEVGGRLRRILAETIMYRANGPVALIAESRSRLGRKPEEVAQLIFELMEAGVEVVLLPEREQG